MTNGRENTKTEPVILESLQKKLKYHILCQVINISSPNTPGLRQLQERKQLKDLVKKV